MLRCRAAGFSINGEISYPTPEKLPAASYVCELSKVPGRFLPDKAMELGVPRGEMFSILKSWKAVTLEDGTVVQPHLVGPLFYEVALYELVMRFQSHDQFLRYNIPPSPWHLGKLHFSRFFVL
jgi:hypothetical protein